MEYLALGYLLCAAEGLDCRSVRIPLPAATTTEECMMALPQTSAFIAQTIPAGEALVLVACFIEPGA